jgi:hypothetical protein
MNYQTKILFLAMLLASNAAVTGYKIFTQKQEKNK